MIVSVIIPAKNEERLLPALLTQLQAQTRKPDEVIIADAHSTDKTRAIAASFGAKVVDGGMPGAGRNAGAAAAKGDLLLFLDADNTIPSDDYLASVLSQFERRRLDMATTTVIPVNGTVLDHLMHRAFNLYIRLLAPIFPHAAGAFMLVRASVHQQINGFDETIHFAEDTDYARRAGKVARYGILRGLSMLVSTRRMEKDGRLRVIWRYLRAGIHIVFKGPIRDNRLKHEFDYSELYGRKK